MHTHAIDATKSGDLPRQRRPWLCWQRKAGMLMLAIASIVTLLVMLWRW